jgi:membrane protein required for beta-lactamase induction
MMNDVPDWLAAAVVGAALAALGYVGKLILEWLASIRQASAARRAKLAQLSSLLRATWVAYSIQNDHARRLESMVRQNHPAAPQEEGFERLFATLCPHFNARA